jgi:hypothetical protein
MADASSSRRTALTAPSSSCKRQTMAATAQESQPINTTAAPNQPKPLNVRACSPSPESSVIKSTTRSFKSLNPSMQPACNPTMLSAITKTTVVKTSAAKHTPLSHPPVANSTQKYHQRFWSQTEFVLDGSFGFWDRWGTKPLPASAYRHLRRIVILDQFANMVGRCVLTIEPTTGDGGRREVPHIEGELWWVPDWAPGVGGEDLESGDDLEQKGLRRLQASMEHEMRVKVESVRNRVVNGDGVLQRSGLVELGKAFACEVDSAADLFDGGVG